MNFSFKLLPSCARHKSSVWNVWHLNFKCHCKGGIVRGPKRCRLHKIRWLTTYSTQTWKSSNTHKHIWKSCRNSYCQMIHIVNWVQKEAAYKISKISYSKINCFSKLHIRWWNIEIFYRTMRCICVCVYVYEAHTGPCVDSCSQSSFEFEATTQLLVTA